MWAPQSVWAQQSAEVTVEVDPSQASTWTIDERVFGKFFEPNGRDAYPGLYAQHLSNSSLEEWYHHGSEPWQGRTSVLFREVEQQGGLAYPWEPAPESGLVRHTLEEDDPTHGGSYQRVHFLTSDARGGIEQRTALPHKRTLEYNLAFSVRSETIDTLTVELMPTGKDSPFGSNEKDVILTDTWRRDTLQFSLGRAAGDCYQADGGVCSPSGKYTVRFTAKGGGSSERRFDLDWAMLIPGDAVEGKYNPTTIDWLKRFNVLSIRWGGNWMSAYQWQDGIGPIRERPVRRNLAWGGLEHNYLGTAEFLELCELVGADPHLNAPFNMDGEYPDVPPEEAANWVEYVNGSTDTEMGQLRASHGHPEPWNVTLWQVGNESYGAYQYGHPGTPEAYGQGMRQYAQAMKAVDSTITLLAAGADPLYRDFNGSAWNRALLEYAGDVIDGIDIHRYVNGVRNNAKRNNNWTQNEYLTMLVTFPTMYEDIIQRLRDQAEEFGYPDMTIDIGEWNLGPANVGGSGWPAPTYPTMANAAFMGGMYNTFLRQSEVVRYTHQRDNTLFYRPFPVDFRAVNPGNYMFKYYAEPFAGSSGKKWSHLPLNVDGPTYRIPLSGPNTDNRFSVRWIYETQTGPYVDAAAIVAEEKDSAYVFLVNRDLENSRSVRVQLASGWKTTASSVGVIRQRSTDGPFNRQFEWSTTPPFLEKTAFEVMRGEQSVSASENSSVSLTMEPASIARLGYSLAKDTEVAGDPSDISVHWALRAPHPNPVTSGQSATVGYGVEQAGTSVDIVLYDVHGRQVRVVERARRGRGWHKAQVRTDGLAAGTYFIQMRAGQAMTKAEPLIVVK